MNIIEAIRLLMKEEIITPRQAARMAVRYLNRTERNSTTSKRKIEEMPYICPTCRQEVLPF